MISRHVVDQLLSSPGGGVQVLAEAGALDAEHLDALLDLAAELVGPDAETAGRLLDVVEEAARPARAQQAAAAAGYLRARLLVQSGQPEQALRHIALARDGYQRLGSQLAALRTDLGRMHVLDDLGRHDEAAAVGRAMLTALDQTEPSLQVAGLRAAALGNVGVSLGFTGRHEEAIEAYRRAESAWRELGQDHEATAALANRGIELLALGDAAAGLDCLQRATTAFEADADAQWLGKCLGHRGAAFAALGRYVEALADYERARPLLASLGAQTESWRLSIETASTLHALGLHDEASSLVQEIIPQLRRAGLDHDLAAALAISGIGNANSGRLDAAREAFAEAAELYTIVNDPPSRARVLLDLSRVSDDAEAMAHATRAAALVQGQSWPGVRCLCLARLAELTAHEPDVASGHLAHARRLAEELGLPHLRLAVAQGEGSRLRRAGDLDAAIAHFEEALGLVETIATPLLDETLRAAFLRSSGETRHGLIAALLGRGAPADVDRAARLADEAKGRTLVEVLQGSLRPRSDPASPDDLVGPALVSQLDAAYSALFGAGHDHRDAARARVEELERRIAVRDALGPRPATRAHDATHPRVLPWTPAVAYHVVDDQIMAFVPQPDGGHEVRLVSDVAAVSRILDDLEAHLGRHAAGVIARHGAARTEACRLVLRELYLRVFAPVRELLVPLAGRATPDGAWPLVVVPHGLLHRVPFHALDDGRNYLLADWAITIAPSLAAAGLASAPAPRRVKAAVVGVADDSTPFIEDEARMVARVAGTSTPVLGAAATLDQVRAAIGQADLVHLACHGLFRQSNPAFSALRLADRWVRVADLADAVADGSIIVLSACETARVNAGGDEATGLARSLLAVGARCVVVSQWVADDRCTATLMVRLHQGLAAGVDPATALRDAQLATVNDYPHPFHWAPFITVGAPS